MKEIWKTIGVILFVVLVAVAAWWFAYGAKVLSSETIGKGDAIIEKNSAENWLKAQAKFEDLYAAIEAQDSMIAVLDEAYDADPSPFNKANYDGARLTCLSLIGDYNSDARNYLSAEFRSADLPARIDTNMPSTNCKE